MSKGIYLIIVLAAGLSVGGAFAQSAGEQKAKQKDKASKEKSDYKEKLAPEAEDDLQRAFSYTMTIGHGGYLGVFLEEVTPDRVKELGLKEERGAIVMKVVDGSPAEKAGLKENDVVVAFNGKRVDSVGELQRIMSETPVGRTVSIEVTRHGGKQTMSATLGKRSDGFSVRQRDAERYQKEGERASRGAERESERALELERKHREMADSFGNFKFVFPGIPGSHRSRLGVAVEPLTGQLAEYFGVKSGSGLLVTEVVENRPAAKAGLKAGDVILAIDEEKTDDVGALASAVARKDEGTITLKIVRSRAEQTVTVTLEKREPRPSNRRGARTAAHTLAAV